MKIKKIFFFLLLSAINYQLSTLFAAASPGTKSGEFLSIDGSCSSRALGGNEGTLIQPEGFLNNPASAGFAVRPGIYLSRLIWLDGEDVSNVAYVFPLLSWAGLGVSYSNMTLSSIEGYDFNDQPTGDYEANESLAAMGVGFRRGELAIGIKGKSWQEDLSVSKGSAFLFDAGLTWNRERFILSVVSLNNGGNIVYDKGEEKEFPVEKNVLLNFGINFAEGSLYTGYVRPETEESWYKTGLRYSPSKNFSLLCGFSSRDDLFSGFSFGAELGFRNILAGYAFSGGEVFGSVHQISLSYVFGESSLKDRLFRRARRLYKSGKIEESREVMEKVLILDPEWKKARELEGKIRRILSTSRPEEGQ